MSQVKKVLVTGGNGYVGNYMLKTMAMQYPEIEMLGMSRRGEPRSDDPITKTLPNVSFVKGNCLEPESYAESLNGVDAIIHTVGILIPNMKDPNRSFKAVNRDAAVNMATSLDKLAAE